MKHYMSKSVKIPLMLATLIAVVLLAALWATRAVPLYIRPRPFETVPGDIELYYIVKTMISAINATLLIFLLITYTGIYMKTKSEFTIGLIIFSMVLLLNAFTSNPFIHGVFGFRAFGLGPFVMLPDLFTCFALAILLYLTFKY